MHIARALKIILPFASRFGSEMAVYAEDSWKINSKWNVQAGLRLNHYSYLGNTTVYYFRDTTANVRKPLDREEIVKSKKPIDSWSFLEPRLSVRYEFKKNTFIKAGYGRSSQYLHLLSNTASPTPVDLYFPSTNNIKPSVTDQLSAGIVTIPDFLPIEFSAEIFYKKMNDLLDYIDNANLELNHYVEADLLTGKGKSYGIELEARKETGKMAGMGELYFLKVMEKNTRYQQQRLVSQPLRPHARNKRIDHS